jgi:hypothetical protein
MPGTVTTAAAVVGGVAFAAAALGCPEFSCAEFGWAVAGSSSIHNAAAVTVEAMKAAGKARFKSDFGTVDFSRLTAFDYRMKSGQFFERYRGSKSGAGCRLLISCLSAA